MNNLIFVGLLDRGISSLQNKKQSQDDKLEMQSQNIAGDGGIL